MAEFLTIAFCVVFGFACGWITCDRTRYLRLKRYIEDHR